jgi:hypothetical protein
MPENIEASTTIVKTGVAGEDLSLYTAALVEEDCPRSLCKLGKEIGAHLDKARKCEDKAEQHYTAVAQLLRQAQKLCDDGAFTAFKAKFCPDLGRSRAYEILAIATGKKSIKQVRAATRERTARSRAKKAESATVAESTATKPNKVETAGNNDATESAQRRRAYYEAAEAGDDPDTATTENAIPDPAGSVSAAPSGNDDGDGAREAELDGDDERLIREGEAAVADYVRAARHAAHDAKNADQNGGDRSDEAIDAARQKLHEELVAAQERVRELQIKLYGTDLTSCSTPKHALSVLFDYLNYRGYQAQAKAEVIEELLFLVAKFGRRGGTGAPAASTKQRRRSRGCSVATTRARRQRTPGATAAPPGAASVKPGSPARNSRPSP